MVEIYSYDVTTHERFARDQQEVEAFRKQYHVPLSGAKTVAVQTAILDFVPKYSALDLLMQTYQHKLWARFVIPENFYTRRFDSSYVAPSLGGSDKQDADIHRLEAFVKRKTQGRYVPGSTYAGQRPDEEKMVQEMEILTRLLNVGVKEPNDMVDYIKARMLQFVQA